MNEQKVLHTYTLGWLLQLEGDFGVHTYIRSTSVEELSQIIVKDYD